ncbi:MAG: hypothetical protein Q9M43_13230 [Sulfurimonas sp.]|nr:hypothetical protein [Sulfurimonas sp.]
MALIYIYSIEKRKVFASVDDIIILSPAMYWFKLCEIPTKNMNKAKKIAVHMMSNKPSNFNDIALFHEADKYNAYMYDKKSILSLLKDLNLKNPKVYFANQLQITELIAVDEETNLYKFNDRVIESRATTNKPLQNLSSHYDVLLKNLKPMLSLEKGDEDLKLVLSISAGVFLLYIMLFAFDKTSTLNSIENEMQNLDTQDRSF